MRALTIENGRISNIAIFDDNKPIPDGWTEAPEGARIGWASDGSGGFIAPSEPDPEPLTELDYSSAIQYHMDFKAKEFGYDSIFTAVTYADEPEVSKFQQEGKALRAWRSLVWAKSYELMGQVKSGARPAPSIEELIAMLPLFPPAT